MSGVAILSPSVRRSPSPIMMSPTPADMRRLSAQSAVSSSAASFQTAPLTASSSTHTITTPGIKENSIPAPLNIPQRPPQEVRIVTVTEDTITLENKNPTALTQSYFTRITGPLPPSPPASIEQEPRDLTNDPLEDEDDIQGYNGRQQEGYWEADTTITMESPPSSPRQRLHRASTDTKASGRTITQTNVPSTSFAPPPLPAGPSKSPGPITTDGSHLHPPVSSRANPTRRNTTGSTPKTPTAAHHAVFASGAGVGAGISIMQTGELDNDILMQEEHIRRERKRARQIQEAEAQLTRSTSRKEMEKEKPLVGNLIGEGHVNYVLMYNMLTGIRIAVSRCQAKIKRDITDEDFLARHKYSFDIIGNELTPSAKYDFKFKDYAPSVFRHLREDHFQLDPADYLLSLTAKYILSELGSPGKSGSFFYFSRDYRFIIKTIHHNEHKFLLRILPQYYEHIKNNPHTLISRFYGLHRVKLPRGRKIHFVIMNNIFPPHRDIHETYDLKGSTIGRLYPEEKAQENPRATLKDLNWINRGKVLEFGPEKRAYLTVQLERDKEFLKQVGVMDYSLLVGIHNMTRGNKDNLRRNTLKIFSPDLPPSMPQRRRTTGHGLQQKPSKKVGSPEAVAMRRAIYRTSDPKRIDQSQLPDSSELENPNFTSDRQHFWFYQDEGGLRATDENNEAIDVIYYLGVIDILTPWTTLKKAEGFWKGLSADKHKISPVPPPEYADRFFAFMKAVMRGGEGGARFKGE